MKCKHCGSVDTEYRGQQKGIEFSTKRSYEYPLYQCNGCDSSFAGEKEYTDSTLYAEILAHREQMDSVLKER